MARIAQVARRMFLRHGYSRTSLNEIKARAGGSKATIVKYFGSKAGLFAAVIAQVAEQFVVDAHFTDLKGTPREVLQQWGESMLGFYVAHDSLSAYRDVIAEGHHYPSMARAFYVRGHEQLRTVLAAQLTQWCDEGLLSIEDCSDCADMFLHMVRAGLHEQRLLGLRKSVMPAEVKARIASAVQLFLSGAASGRQPRTS